MSGNLTPQEKKEIQAIDRETAQSKAQGSKVKDATVDTTVRLVRLGEETRQIGASTLRDLDEQGSTTPPFTPLVLLCCTQELTRFVCLFVCFPFVEQLRRIAKGEGQVHENITEATYQTYRLKGLFGIGKKKRARREGEAEKLRWDLEDQEDQDLAASRASLPEPQVSPGRRWQLGNWGKRATSAPLPEKPDYYHNGAGVVGDKEVDRRDQKIDDNLDLVSQQVAELLEQSRVMGDALDRQNVELDKVTKVTDRNNERAKAATIKIQKFL